MFRHVVMFRWNDGVTADQIVATSAALDALADEETKARLLPGLADGSVAAAVATAGSVV